jgi:hypothetical protein
MSKFNLPNFIEPFVKLSLLINLYDCSFVSYILTLINSFLNLLESQIAITIVLYNFAAAIVVVTTMY